jgi:spore germination protein KA
MSVPDSKPEQPKIKQLLEEPFHFYLDKNVEIIKKIIQPSVDFHKRDFVFQGEKEYRGTCFYTEGLVNEANIQKILKSLIIFSPQLDKTLSCRHLTEKIKTNLMVNSVVKEITTFQEGVDAIFSGDTLLLIDYCTEALVVSPKGWETRSISPPETEAVVRGPRDGFTESIRTNTAHVRRRIRDPLLRFEPMVIGTSTRTDINIAYIKGIVKENLVEEVRERLQKIKIDGILESGYIEEFIEDSPLSPFPTVQSTERPDKVASALLEGKVAIFVDNTPFVLIVPTSFWEYLQAPDDYYSRYLVRFILPCYSLYFRNSI